MKMIMILALGITICYTSVLYAQTIGPYVGVGIAHASYHMNDMTFEELPYNYVFTGRPSFTGSIVDATTKTTWALYGGYQFSRYLAIEALYQPLGKYSRQGRNAGLVNPGLSNKAGFGPGPFVILTDIDTLQVQGYGLTALASIPVAKYMFVFGRLGGFYWDGKLERAVSGKRPISSASTTYYLSEKGSGYSPMYGIGIRIEVKRGLSVRGEWMHIDSIGGGLSTGKSSANVSTLSAEISF